ncbi:MAG: hypothetical protein KDK91_04575, partial [Gammaproteobacteria bacterium]|nr:hypothetical protein [Gammaproteobacteria bacterium]
MHDPDSMRGRRRPAGVVRIASLAVGAVLMVAQPRLFELDVVEPIDTGAVSMGRIFPALFPQALARTEGTDVADKRWTCPMHPHYIATEFGTCPICGMDLV